MSKIPIEPIFENPELVEPVLENPEIAVPAIVAVRGAQIYDGVSRLHDAYDQYVGVQREGPPPVDVSSLNNTPTAGGYIAHPIRRYPITTTTTTSQPVTRYVDEIPDDDNLSWPDDIDLPFDDENDEQDLMYDVPLESGLRARGTTTRVDQPLLPDTNEVADDAPPAQNQGNQGGSRSSLSRITLRLTLFAIAAGTAVRTMFPYAEDPVIPGTHVTNPTADPAGPGGRTGNPEFDPPADTGNPTTTPDVNPPPPAPTVPPGNITSNTTDWYPPLLPPETGDPTFDLPPTRPISPIIVDPPDDFMERSGPSVVMKETRIPTTLPTLPALLAGVALGVGISSYATAWYFDSQKKSKKRKVK